MHRHLLHETEGKCGLVAPASSSRYGHYAPGTPGPATTYWESWLGLEKDPTIAVAYLAEGDYVTFIDFMYQENNMAVSG